MTRARYVTALGIALVAVGAGTMIWVALLDGPDPGSVCGRDPNLVVVYGASDEPLPGAEADCQGRARRELFRGLVASAVPIVGGGALTLLGSGQRQMEQRRRASRDTSDEGYGRRSEDGTHWWTGTSWRRIGPDQEAPPPPPTPAEPSIADGFDPLR